MKERAWNSAVISIAGIAAALILDMAEVRPNRISSGVRFGTFDFMGIWAFVMIASWVVIMALSLYNEERPRNLIPIIGAISVASIFAAMIYFPTINHLEGSSPRISLLSGIYVQVLLVYLLITSIKLKETWSWTLRLIPVIIIMMPAAAAFLGYYDSYSLLKEYSIKRQQFSVSLWTHFVLSAGSVLAAAGIAIPLGYIAYKKRGWEDRVMVPLGIIETIPSLSLFGLLLVPLSALGSLRIFKALGVSGIGWAPAFVALTLYALLPIARNTLSGFNSLDRAAIDAANGMGMSPSEILFKVELPLALPVLFTGIRIALVQTIGGAVLAGLVGGGGLGSFVFLGLAEASTDLVLLGVIPIVLFTIWVDGGLRIIEKSIRRAAYD